MEKLDFVNTFGVSVQKLRDKSTYKMFQVELSDFIECSGLKKYSHEQMDRKFKELVYTGLRAQGNPEIGEKENRLIANALLAMFEDHSRRQAYRMMITPALGKEA